MPLPLEGKANISTLLRSGFVIRLLAGVFLIAIQREFVEDHTENAEPERRTTRVHDCPTTFTYDQSTHPVLSCNLVSSWRGGGGRDSSRRHQAGG
jgi:hypothetical protein